MKTIEQRSSEEIATSIMHKVLNGDRSALDGFLKNEISPGLLDHVLSGLKNSASDALHKGQYKEAIEFYTQALAGTQDRVGQSRLYSSIALAYLEMKQYSDSLKAARETITLNPQWSRGWYRVAQIFHKEKKYTTALTVIKVALKRDPNDVHVQKLYNTLIPLAKKEKALERLSVDYSRFLDIKVPDNDIVQEEVPFESVIEYADGLTAQQKKQLDCLLNNGNFTTESQAAEQQNRPLLKFNLETYQSQIVLQQKRLKFPTLPEEICQKTQEGLIKLLQTRSELMLLRSIAFSQLLYAPALLETYIQCISNLSETYEKKRKEKPVSWFFLGVGTSVPLVYASKLDTLSHCITACTNHEYPFTAWMAERMLDLHNVDKNENMKLLMKRLCNMTIASPESDPLETELKDMTFAKANILVIDQECFDSAGVTKGVLDQIYDARTRFCVNTSNEALGFESVPSSMRIFVYGASVMPTNESIRRLVAEKNKIYANVSMEVTDDSIEKVITQGRWGIGWEPLQNTSYDDFETNLKDNGITLLTEPYSVDEFRFNGPLETLDQDIPFEKCIDTNSLNCIQSGYLNCIVVRCEFSFPKHNKDQAISVLHHYTKAYGSAGPALTWVPPRHVHQGSLIPFTYRLLNRSEISITLPDLPWSQPWRTRSIPRWQYDAISDTDTLQELQNVLREKFSTLFLNLCNRLDSKPYLATSTSQGVEVLLLNSCLGTLAFTVLEAAARILASRGCRPSPSFHLNVIEPSEAHAVVTKAFLTFLHKQVNESEIRQAFILQNPSKQWVSFQEDKHLVKDQQTDSTEASLQSINQLRKRATVCARNVCSLRPNGFALNSTAQLAVKRLLNQPPSAQLPQDPAAYTLPEKVNIVVSQMIDATLLGEGLLPVLEYAREALTKPKFTVIPASARIYAAAIQLGKDKFNFSKKTKEKLDFIKPSCWYKHLLGDARSALELTPQKDCFSVNLDHVEHTWMTPPTLLFEFNFAEPSKTNYTAGGMSTNMQPMSLTCSNDGFINGIIFWYEVDFEPKTSNENKLPRGYSTRPRSLAEQPGLQRRSSQALQACYLLSDVLVFSKNELVPLIFWHTRSSLGTTWNKELLPDYVLRVRSSFSVMKPDNPAILAWKECADQYEKHIDQLGTILSDFENNVSTIQTVANQLIYIIQHAYTVNRQAYIDREETFWFFLSLFT